MGRAVLSGAARRSLGVAIAGGVWFGAACGAVWAADQPASTVQNNMDVGMEYTLTVDGAVVDSTNGRGPFHYIHGRGQIVLGLERELTGLKVNDTKEVTVKPEEGYGNVDPAAVVEVPKSQLPNETPPAVGMMLQGVNPSGQTFRAMIEEVKADTVKLNLNHPLAGKTLNFKIKIASIASAPPAPAP